jgi:hypothetical protein
MKLTTALVVLSLALFPGCKSALGTQYYTNQTQDPIVPADGTQNINGDLTISGALAVGAYTRHIHIPVSAATLGPTAPALVVTGTTGCLGFDRNVEVAHLAIDLPADWVGSENVTLRPCWHAESGDQIAQGETVKWNVSYHATVPGEAVDNGTTATATATYTEASNPGVDKESIFTDITLAYDNGNQPLVADDCIRMAFLRDVDTDTYSGDAIVCGWVLEYRSNKLSTH